jgi:hypothetical protein
MMFLSMAVSACAAPQGFSLRSIVAGNWSTSSGGRLRVLYFVPVHGIGHFQALLNDRFLDIFIASQTSARVLYGQYNFTISVSDPEGPHPTALAEIADSLFVDICLLSNSAFELALIDARAQTVTGWSFIRPHLTGLTKGSLIQAAVSLVGIVFFAKKTIDYCLAR